MARHQSQNRLALARPAWLAIVLFGALPGCNRDSRSTNSVHARPTNVGVPTVNRVHADAVALATSTEEIPVPDPSPSEPVAAVMVIRPNRAAVGQTVDVLVRIRIASAHKVLADLRSQDLVLVARAQRLLERYVPIGPSAGDSDAWASWWKENQRFAFASDSGDYRWYIDPLAKKRGVPTREMRGPKRASQPFSDLSAGS
jgi:hypothetical protein